MHLLTWCAVHTLLFLSCFPTDSSPAASALQQHKTSQRQDGSHLAAQAAQPTPWEGPLKKLTLCSDECVHAKDNVCQEGRPKKGTQVVSGSGYDVLCDLGTDCSDCGAWEFEGPEVAAQWRPVAEVKKKNVRREGGGVHTCLWEVGAHARKLNSKVAARPNPVRAREVVDENMYTHRMHFNTHATHTPPPCSSR